MTGRVLKVVGGALAAVAAAGLGVYFSVVGLDESDKLGSVIGAFVGLAGLAVAVYGIVRDRRANSSGDSGPGGSAVSVQNNSVTDFGNLFASQGGNVVVHQAPIVRTQPPEADEGTANREGGIR